MTNELSVLLLKIAAVIYVAAAFVYVAQFLSARKDTRQRLGTALLAAGLLPHLASLVVRTVVAQRPPFLNLFEYVSSLTFGVVLLYLIVETMTKTKTYGVLMAPLIALAAVFAVRLPTAINATLPALQSAWRVPHIATAILAYSAFFISFAVAILYLIKERSSEDGGFWGPRLPSLKELDHTVYRLIAFGFLMQTALLLTGAVWAQYVFGRPWSWDPKEDWALITWLVYAAYLHTRVSMGWRGRRSIILAVVGLVVVAFTLFGVSFLGRGYHAAYS